MVAICVLSVISPDCVGDFARASGALVSSTLRFPNSVSESMVLVSVGWGCFVPDCPVEGAAAEEVFDTFDSDLLRCIFLIAPQSDFRFVPFCGG